MDGFISRDVTEYFLAVAQVKHRKLVPVTHLPVVTP